ncbi:MAG: glycosyltransferase [Pseudomonadota bacterium]
MEIGITSQNADQPADEVARQARVLPGIVVGIASTGRAETLARVLPYIEALDPAPERILIAVVRTEDHAGVTAERVPLEIVMTGRRGLCAQRNDILARCPEDGIVVFFDDDFVPEPGYLGAVAALMDARPEAVMVTGTVLADGILGPGLALQDAAAIVRAAQASPKPDPERASPVHNGYGCNMAIRMAPVAAAALRFDEGLPLYGWLEDVDFSRRLAAHGPVLKSEAARGVHLGVKSGRSPGLRLGYSQVVNPLYLWRKGSLAGWRALRQVGRNLAANSARSFYPEPWVDRTGRLRGNLLGLGHVLTGRLDPGRASEL